MDSKQLVLDLLSAFKEQGIGELEFRQGDLRIKLKRESRTVAPPLSHPHLFVAPPAHIGPSVSPGHEVAEVLTEPAHQEVAGTKGETITAPMVGTFYRAPTPDAPPFVEEGQEVEAEQPLCIIEAMKQMNRFEVDFACRIVSILVENATMIEYGQPLFEVERL